MLTLARVRSSGAEPTGSNFRAVSDTVPQDALYGALTPKDTSWTCAGGFTTETQVWYAVLSDGAFVTSQVIHSAVG